MASRPRNVVRRVQYAGALGTPAHHAPRPTHDRGCAQKEASMSRLSSTSLQGAVVLFSVAASLTGQSGAPTFRFEVVARTADLAPGFPVSRFDRFGPLPGNGGELRAAIDDGGRVAFHAFIGDGNPATFSPGASIWKRDGSLAAVAVLFRPAPGTNSLFGGFPSLLGPVAPDIHDGHVTLVGALDGNASQQGIWSERSGALAPVLLTSDTLPDTPAGSIVFEFTHALRGNAIIVDARYKLAGAGSIGSDTEGLWIDTDGTFKTIAAKGVPAPGTGPGVVFDAGTSLAVFGPVDAWDANRAGEVVFNGYLGGAGIDIFDDEGIWSGSAGHLALLVREGQSVPGQPAGVRFGSPSGFTTFGNSGEVLSPTLNDRGSVLFGAVLSGPGADHVLPAFLLRDGHLQLLARASSSLPGTPPGDAAAGYPAPFTYASFFAGALNNSDDVVLEGFATTGDPLNMARAIWRDRANGLELVAGSGRPVAAIPGLAFAAVKAAGLSDLGLLYYTGQLTGPGVGPANDGALFVMDAQGRHRVVVREGDSFDLSGTSTDVRVVAGIEPGVGISDGGAKVLVLEFTDGHSAVVVAEPDLALVADTRFFSASSGGTVHFGLDAGATRAGRPYVLGGSGSGTLPGLDLGSGGVAVDLHELLLSTLGGGPPFVGFFGVLDSNGRGTASLSVPGPLPTGLVGHAFDFAFVAANPLDFASNAVPLTVVR